MLPPKLMRQASRISIVVLAFVATGTPVRAAGASFACHVARGPVERAICDDPALADLDVAMAESFRVAVRRDPIGKAKLLDRQRLWLASRRKECNLRSSGEASSDNRLCLHAIYTARIATLREGAAR